MKAVRTLVLLADDREARFLVNEGVGKGLRQVGHLAGGDSEATAAGFADQRGRGQAAPGAARHGMEPATTEEELRRDVFAARVVEEAAARWSADGYDRLMIAAPAKMLGELRARLPKPLAGAVAAELAKDLVHVPLKDLPGHFAEVAAF